MASIFGKRPLFNPDQRFGEGFDPSTGTMSFSGSPITQEITPPPSSQAPQSVASQTPKLTTLQKLGLAGDVLTGRPITRQRLDAEMAPMLEQAAEARRQAAQFDLWRQQQEYKRANPETPQPTEFERLVNASGLPPEQRTQVVQDYVRNRAKNGGASLITAPSGVTFTPIPAPGGAGSSSPRPFR